MTFRRPIQQSHIFTRLRTAALLILLVLFHGCATMEDILVDIPFPGQLEEYIETNDFLVPKEDDVMGQLGLVQLKDGDTLPDIARHYSLGINTVSAANPGADTWVPDAGEQILLPLSFTLPDAPRKGIVINLAAMRIFHFKKGGSLMTVSTYPVGVGTEERPTPMGRMYVTRKKVRPTWYVPASIAADHRKKGDPLPAKVPPGPENPLGEYALYLSKASYLVHGTNKPASIGLRATNGCIRLYPEDVRRLFKDTPVKTPVRIVNQPYLVGRRDGLVYLEAHTPFEESGAADLKKAYAKLKMIEKKSGQALDWDKIDAVVTDARGYPVPVLATIPEKESYFTRTIKLKHPGKLFGKPEVPELKSDAWYVLAAVLSDKAGARRLSEIINHQGPPIPARVLSTSGRHRVLAGPFNTRSEAKKAAKRLKIYLELDGILVEPT